MQYPVEVPGVALEEMLVAAGQDAGEVAGRVAAEATRVGLDPRLLGRSLNVDLLALEPWQRARAGLFLAMQYPVEVPGVALEEMLVHWRARGRRFAFGNGTKVTALYATIDHGKQSFWMTAVHPDCVEIAFRWLKISPPFRQAWAARGATHPTQPHRRRRPRLRSHREVPSLPDRSAPRPSTPCAIP
jgi:hypothetical protein